MGTGTVPPPSSTASSARGGGPHPALAQLAARGGCLLEPWLDRVRDLSVQLYVHKDGRIEVLGTTTQLVTRSGQILGNRGVLIDGRILSGASSAEEEALCGAAEGVGGATAGAGFFGVAGIDAFVFRGEGDRQILRPVVELNARFTTGTVALGLVRLAERAGLANGLSAWALVLKGDKKGGTSQAPTPPRGVRSFSPLARGPVLYLAPSPEALDEALAQLGGGSAELG
jgi:hypothetical protein